MTHYYSPKLFEFYQGFEYETSEIHLDKNDENIINIEWFSEKFTFTDFENVQHLLSLGIDNLRVQYLDDNDIVELGFERSPVEPDNWFYIKVDNY